VAALPLAAGLFRLAFEDPARMAAGFPVAMTVCRGGHIRRRAARLDDDQAATSWPNPVTEHQAKCQRELPPP